MPDSPTHSPPKNSFDWLIYADATLAGLAVLIPIIGLDWLVEEFFRRRIPGQIAKHRGRPLPGPVQQQMNRNYDNGYVKSCLLLPVMSVYWLLKRLSRKILYFLSVKEAADNVNYYWHVAYLTDYALAAGHLETPESARLARRSMEQVINTTVNSPLYQLAVEIVQSAHHILRTAYKFVRGQDSNVIGQLAGLMSGRWAEFDAYFETIEAFYQQTHDAALRQHTAETQTAPPPDPFQNKDKD